MSLDVILLALMLRDLSIRLTWAVTPDLQSTILETKINATHLDTFRNIMCCKLKNVDIQGHGSDAITLRLHLMPKVVTQWPHEAIII